MITDMIEFWKDMFTGSWLDLILGFIFAGLILVLLASVCYFFYWAIDSWFQPSYSGYGIVTEKSFTPAHMQTTYMYNAATKTNMPIITHIPDSWDIQVKVEARYDYVGVNREFFYLIKEGDPLKVVYRKGRINQNNIYIDEVSK